MTIPKNRQGFSEYCLRNLGSPVIDINVAEEQISDRIDEAMEVFQKHHYDAIEKTYMLYKITNDTITNNSIPLSSDIVGVISVSCNSISNTLLDWTTNLGSSYRNMLYDIYFNPITSSYSSLGNYTMMMIRVADINFLLAKQLSWNFHQYMNKVVIHDTISEVLKVDDYILLEVFKVINPSTYPNVWADRWLQSYATALIGRQWGNNLSKYAGVQLPGGVTLDGDKIFDRYQNEIEKLEEQLDLKFTLPPDFIVG